MTWRCGHPRTPANTVHRDGPRCRTCRRVGAAGEQEAAREEAGVTEREQERAAVVAWLRKVAPKLVRGQEAALEKAADNIEAGAHLKGEK